MLPSSIMILFKIAMEGHKVHSQYAMSHLLIVEGPSSNKTKAMKLEIRAQQSKSTS
jgi:hypothetical protein